MSYYLFSITYSKICIYLISTIPNNLYFKKLRKCWLGLTSRNLLSGLNLQKIENSDSIARVQLDKSVKSVNEVPLLSNQSKFMFKVLSIERLSKKSLCEIPERDEKIK